MILRNHYPFDGNSIDVTGGDNGTDVNISYQPGKIQQAAEFDGGAGISVHGPFCVSNTPQSYCFWLKSYTSNVSQFILDESSNSGTGGALSIRINSNNHIRFWSYDAAVILVDSIATILPDTWYHVACVVDAGSHKIYINGDLDITGNIGYGVTVPGAARMGFSEVFPGNFIGLLDDLRIYNDALTAQEIKTLASSKSGANFFQFL